MTVRQSSLERLGALRRQKQGQNEQIAPNRLQTYYERQVLKNADGQLSRRRIDAFLGLCASSNVRDRISTDFIINGLRDIVARWPTSSEPNASAGFSNLQLRHISRVGLGAIIEVGHDSQDIEQVYTFILDMISEIKAQEYDVRNASKEVVILVGALEVAIDHPAAFTFSHFITTTRNLTDLLQLVHAKTPQPDANSFDELSEVLDASQNYLLQLQEKSAKFVLSWSEHACSLTFSTGREHLWEVLRDDSRLEAEDQVVDEIVWATVKAHIATQNEISRYIELSTTAELVSGFLLRTACLEMIASHDYNESVVSWIAEMLPDLNELDDLTLGVAIVDVVSVLATRFPAHASESSQMLRDVIRNSPPTAIKKDSSLSVVAATALLAHLERTSEDALIGTISTLADAVTNTPESEIDMYNGRINGSDNGYASSIVSSSVPNERFALNSVQAIGLLGSKCRNSKISVLALNILLQKASRASEAALRQIVIEVTNIVLRCADSDVLRVCEFHSRLESGAHDQELSSAIKTARILMAKKLEEGQSTTADLYLVSLLRSAIGRAKLAKTHEMESILVPLAVLLQNRDQYSDKKSYDLRQLFHNFWFTLVLVGFTVSSSKVTQHLRALRTIARGSPSLALETMTDAFETDLESYPLLKQAHQHEETKNLQRSLEAFVPGTTSRARDFSEAVYMNALALLENLKCQAGVATGSLAYYRQATMVQSEVADLLAAISVNNISYFLRFVESSHGKTSLGQELQALVVGCCDPILSVRTQSILVIDQIVSRIPSAFYDSLAITTLLECITLLGWAAYEEFSDKYSPNYEFRSSRMDLCITVSDSFADRHNNLESAQRSARKWLSLAMLESAADVRTLLTTYITLTEDHTGSVPSDRGKLLAIEMALQSSARDQPTEKSFIRDASDAFLGELTLRHLQASNGSYLPSTSDSHDSTETLNKATTLYQRSLSRKFIPFSDLREKLCSYVNRILTFETFDPRILRQLVEIPFNIFSISSTKLATSLWARIVTDKPELEAQILSEIARCWNQTMKHRRGLFSTLVNADDPFSRVMEYAPTDKEAIAKEGKVARTLLAPHLVILRFLSGRLATPQRTSPEAQKILLRVVRNTMKAMTELEVCDHIFSRELRLRVLIMATRLKSALGTLGLTAVYARFSVIVYDAALSMFSTSPRWAFGSDVGQMKVDRQLIAIFLQAIRVDAGTSKTPVNGSAQLLILLLEQESIRIELWLNPLAAHRNVPMDTAVLQSYLPHAWRSNPSVAISLAQRFSSTNLKQSIRSLILQRPWQCLHNQYAAEYVLGTSLPMDARQALRYLLYWTPVVPISATTYFLPSFRSHPLVLQYAMRSLESHPVEVTFFYVPQIVQVLRHDALGYVRRFIVETAKLSQLFAHQIIWNFDANAFKDEDATIPDTIKPTLDSIKASMMANLSGPDKTFYETEFRFFGEVTSISGKLKPFIKKTKPEKKAKIDEEMALIKVEQGVYLPSNPDGQVINIDRKSGRPLQSHAKAPFMATFIIRKSRQVEAAFEDDLQVENDKNRQSATQKQDVIEKRQSAIFKVGDDCRQDVLALQLISTFRSVFNSIGLDLYVFPYRVTATAPGCGVIDVLPNSISRDMLGREAVNGLYDYFLTTFGKPETVAFQQARMNFVKSLAAYSVITYLLQFKDRHNGNIMYDALGHVLHIDFGFCFDIAPGGITFESAPFKLTTEMVAVMGGSIETQSYKMFQELCVKAFLVARQYSEQIIHLVTLMLDSGLPCFKGQTTITNLRNRFYLNVSEQQASQVMLGLIEQSHQNQRTVAYDMFQKLTNGIPY